MQRNLETTNVSTCTNTEKRNDTNYMSAPAERPLPSISFTATQVTVRSAKGFLSSLRSHTRDNGKSSSAESFSSDEKWNKKNITGARPSPFVRFVWGRDGGERERDILLSASFLVGGFQFDVTKKSYRNGY